MIIIIIRVFSHHQCSSCIIACAVRLAASSEPQGTDHTGEITSFSDVGGGGAPTIRPRPWICYTSNSTGVEWQDPSGSTVVTGSVPATGDQLFTVTSITDIALVRGPIRTVVHGTARLDLEHRDIFS